MKTYYLAEIVRVNGKRVMPLSMTPNQKVKGILTGEKRKPKKGELYISGAIPQVYQAPNDLSSEYYIAKLVNVKLVTVTKEIITDYEY